MTEEFGDLVLLIGDFYVPQRRPCFPKPFQELLNTDKISHVLCTGNIGSVEILEMLNKTASNVHIVKGDCDVELPNPPFSDYPDYKVVQIGQFKIGLIHGHQVIPWNSSEALCEWQRRLDCDIIVSGFSNSNSAQKVKGKFFINPGTATGAFRPYTANAEMKETVVPSFMLMSVKGATVVLYVYEYKDGKVTVGMSDFEKEDFENETH